MFRRVTGVVIRRRRMRDPSAPLALALQLRPLLTALPAPRAPGLCGCSRLPVAALMRVDAMSRHAGRSRAELVPRTPGRGRAHASMGGLNAFHEGANVHDSEAPRQWAFRLKPGPPESLETCR